MWNYHMGFGSLRMVMASIFLLIIILFIVYLIHLLKLKSSISATANSNSYTLKILSNLYACDEIDAEEFQLRKERLVK